MVLTSVPVGSTPFASEFPGATHALHSVVTVSGITGDAYQYIILGTNLLNPGNKAIAPFILGSTITLENRNVPVDTTYALPSTLGTTWGSTFVTTQTIAINGTTFGTPTTTNDTISYTVDAYGPMTVPGGGVYDALRIRKDERKGTRSIGYIFLAKNGASVQLTASDPSQPNSGVIQLAGKSLSWTGPTTLLPIQLSYFRATLDAGRARVELHWGTLSELNNFGFEVQKSARIDGEFRTIAGGFVPGHGTTTVPQEYTCIDFGVADGTWFYRLKQSDLDGTSHYSEAVSLHIVTAAREGSAPALFLLEQNYPNPFNPSTKVRFSLPHSARVSLKLYDLLGREVMTLLEEELTAGVHDVPFDAAGLSSGVYVYRLQAGGLIAARKMVFCK
jgi:hypothetical protein